MAQIAPAQPLHVIKGLGNMLRHQYDVIHLRTIYNTAFAERPELAQLARNELDRQRR